MKLRPTIFISGVSSEFASFRDAVEVEIQKKDCFPLNQPSFGVDYRTIEEILRRNIGEADAVIHVVGFRFGFEPQDRPEGKPRRSYTQMEYDIARELNKPVYVFLSADASVRDPNPGEQPEDGEAVQLQLEHRRTLEQLNNIRYSIRDKSELCRLVAAIPLLATADFRVDIGRIDRYAPAELVGREDELKVLDDAWLKVRRAETKRPHIITFVALGGEGKTSLVAKWAATLAHENWPGCDSAFAWSFYSQDSHEQSAASSDLFLKEAISFFGNDADREFAGSSAGAYGKGQRLARIVSQRRALLILDGLEPLQYAPTFPTPGELKDSGIVALLKGLAADSDGLCIVTTRYSVSNLRNYWQATAPEIPLNRLSPQAGMHLLKILGVNGSENEFERLVESVKGHALTLNLLGTYLRDAHGGDIRRRDVIKLEEANREEQGGHAFRVMEAYEQSFRNEGERGKRVLAILRLFGFFDRPMTADSLAALLKPPAIKNLTESLVNLSEVQLNLAFKRMEDAKLITINRQASRALVSLDAHPLVREYAAQQLRTKQAGAWRQAHKRLYEHLTVTTPEKEEFTLEDLQPLYQAVAHGCYAGLQKEVYENVYLQRIKRDNNYYSISKLGAFASDLGAIACFFDEPWKCVNASLSPTLQSLVLAQAAYYLRSLGRLTEALDPMRAALQMNIAQENWKSAAINASNLSDLEMTLGGVNEVMQYAKEIETYADRCGEPYQRITKRARTADILHQAGHRPEALKLFREAEQMQIENFTEHKYLYSLGGFLYCDLLLSVAECAAWRRTLESGNSSLRSDRSLSYLETFHEVLERVSYSFEIAERNNWLTDIAQNQLMRCRAVFYEMLLSKADLPRGAKGSGLRILIETATNDLRRGGVQQYVLRGLLTRAWLYCMIEPGTGLERAWEDITEAWEIAERGPMKLFMADIHLYRARLFFREKEYPWESAEADLKAARKLIEQCGYWRRKEELEDAERVILKKSV